MENLPKRRQLEELLLTTSKPSILDLLGPKDSERLKAHLDTFRSKGLIDHTLTLAIPFYDRIPQLIQQEGGRDKVSFSLAAALASAFNNIDKAGMEAKQIRELAENIIDSSHEDQLSIQDVLLFLKDMLMGKFGRIKDKMDCPMFFDMFEKYRFEKYRTWEAQRYDEHLTLKNAGHVARSCGGIIKREDEDAANVLDLMQTYYEGKKDE